MTDYPEHLHFFCIDFKIWCKNKGIKQASRSLNSVLDYHRDPHFIRLLTNLSRFIIKLARLLALTISERLYQIVPLSWQYIFKFLHCFSSSLMLTSCCYAIITILLKRVFCIHFFYSLTSLFHLVLKNYSPSQPFMCYLNQSSLWFYFLRKFTISCTLFDLYWIAWMYFWYGLKSIIGTSIGGCDIVLPVVHLSRTDGGNSALN